MDHGDVRAHLANVADVVGLKLKDVDGQTLLECRVPVPLSCGTIMKFPQMEHGILYGEMTIFAHGSNRDILLFGYAVSRYYPEVQVVLTDRSLPLRLVDAQR